MSKPIIAKTISYLLHPLYMPTIGVLIIIYLSPHLAIFISPPVIQTISLTMLLLTLTCPVLATIYVIRKRKITTLQLENHRERLVPLTYTLLFYTLTCSLLKIIPGVPLIIYLYVLGSTATVLAALLINYKWKISTHMMGIGGVVGMLIALSYILMENLEMLILPAVLIAGIIGYARLKLNAHTPEQVLAGFTIGVLSQFILFV
ncbi:MAG: hypothetical protein IH948_06865 [Bacteroidetes bacterium]|nr:hypothetical protein [Bacteroidota bacterium]